MSNAAALRTARYNMALRRRGRAYADALTVWTPGLTVVGADQANGMLQSGVAMFVQDDNGNAFVALTSGTTGDVSINGATTVVSDGGVTWQPWPGIIRSMPPTPTPL